MTSIEKTKVYYPETIEEQPLPGIPYAGITGVPQSLREINANEGLKLDGIEVVNGNPQWIKDIVNERINTASKNILKDFNFGDADFAGGVYAGNIAWNTGNGSYVSGSGIVLNRRGIIGANGSQVTFSIDATTGDATFRGDITASTVTGGTISGTTITGSTITGGTIQTASSGLRIRLTSSNTNRIEFLSGSTLYGLLQVDSSGTDGRVRLVDPYNGNYGLYLIATIGSGSNTQASLIAQGAQISAGGSSSVYSSQLIVDNDYFGAYRTGGSNKLFTNLRLDGNWLPFSNNSYTLGSSTYRWSQLHTNSITLNGDTRTSWPAAGTTTLSGLTIDVDKNWSGYRITNINRITLSGVGAYLNCNSGYIDNARAIYFELGRTTNPNVSGQMNYFDGSVKGFRGHVNGFTGQFQLNSL